MPDSLADLEHRRAAIAQQISQLGDLRPGSITATSGRCGKPSCRCHRPGQPVHGPNLRLTYKSDGKTVSESLPDNAAARKAEREIAEFRDFQRLSYESVEVNSTICRLRPVDEEALDAQEKNGRNDPKGSRPRSRPTAPPRLPRLPPIGPPRSGGHRDGCAFRHAPGGGGAR